MFKPLLFYAVLLFCNSQNTDPSITKIDKIQYNELHLLNSSINLTYTNNSYRDEGFDNASLKIKKGNSESTVTTHGQSAEYHSRQLLSTNPSKNPTLEPTLTPSFTPTFSTNIPTGVPTLLPTQKPNSEINLLIQISPQATRVPTPSPTRYSKKEWTYIYIAGVGGGSLVGVILVATGIRYCIRKHNDSIQSNIALETEIELGDENSLIEQ
ncbi:MAG: hypothetical protein AAF770_03795 [Bacteroidota bacterium]